MQLRFLAEPPLDRAVDPRIKRVLVIVRNYALEDDAPGLLWTIGKTQTLERNGHHADVALRGYLAPGIPDRVPRGIVAVIVSPDVIELDAAGIDHETIGTAAIVEGIDVNLHLVMIGINLFAPGHAGANLTRLIVEANEDGVEILLIVADVNHCLLDCGRAFFRAQLHEIVDRGHVWRVGAGLHLEKVFELRGVIDTWDCNQRMRYAWWRLLLDRVVAGEERDT